METKSGRGGGTDWETGIGIQNCGYRDFILLGFKITLDSDCSHEIKRCLLFGRKAMANLDSIFKKQRHYFANKGLPSQSYGFSSSHMDVRVGL